MDVVSTPDLAQQVQITKLASIIQALVDGELFGVCDAKWLPEQARTRGLGPHEFKAVDALRTRLREGAPLLRDGPRSGWY